MKVKGQNCLTTRVDELAPASTLPGSSILMTCAFISFCLLLHPMQDLYAQTDSLSTNYLGGGYFSEGGFYPGITIAFERSLLSNRNFEIVTAGRAGTYFHYRNNTGIFLMIQSGQRIRLYKQLYFEHYVGVGYLHTFLNGGDAYYVDATGSVRKKTNAGNPHFMPSISFGLGYNTRINDRPVRFYGRPIIFWLIPFNKTSLVQYGLEIGALINLRQ